MQTLASSNLQSIMCQHVYMWLLSTQEQYTITVLTCIVSTASWDDVISPSMFEVLPGVNASDLNNHLA